LDDIFANQDPRRPGEAPGGGVLLFSFELLLVKPGRVGICLGGVCVATGETGVGSRLWPLAIGLAGLGELDNGLEGSWGCDSERCLVADFVALSIIQICPS
jgi:hypothetical protein